LRKINDIQKLKEETANKAKQIMKVSYKPELINLIFSFPYVKIKLLERHNIAKRQTASVYLQQLVKANILEPLKKVGKEQYFVNRRLMEIIRGNYFAAILHRMLTRLEKEKYSFLCFIG
jgi:Fic family protein